MSTYLQDVKYCPLCGGQKLEERGTVFIEDGPYNGNYYANEGNYGRYQCLDCKSTFGDMPPGVHETERTREMKRLTQAIAREYIQRLGGSFRKDDFGDYRVKFERAEYICYDLNDAIGTARVMAGRAQGLRRSGAVPEGRGRGDRYQQEGLNG